jgi:energy-coupling factor transporter transmembrane protein EcfT
VLQALGIVVFSVPAVVEALIGLRCLLRHPRSRVLAAVLLLVVPWQVLSLVYGYEWLSAWHTPSSVEQLGDGFDLFFRQVAITVGLYVASFGLAVVVWLRALLAPPVLRAGSRPAAQSIQRSRV